MAADTSKEIQQLMKDILNVRYVRLEEEKRACLDLLNLAQKESYLYGIAFANIYLGDYYVGQNDSEKCSPYLVEGMRISEENGYLDLQLCGLVLMGLYGAMTGDVNGSMQYYIEGLRIAQMLGDLAAQCRIYNNICHDYKTYGNYPEAKKYGIMAYQFGDFLSNGNDEQKLMYLIALSTLVDLCIMDGALEESQAYAVKMEEVKLHGPLRNLYVYQNWCCYYAEVGDKVKSLYYAEKMLAMKVYFLRNRMAGFEACLNVCRSMILLEQKQFAWEFFEILSACSDEEGTGYLSNLLEIKMSIVLKFSSPEDQDVVYEEYYHKKLEIDRVNNQARSEAMKNKIHLHQVILEQENMKKLNQNLETEAHIDELTTLYNRRYFNHLKSRYAADSHVKTLGYIMIDVDCFKEYNDLYGHPKGDKVLRAIGGCLLKLRHSRIYVCRFGGDEFICLCVNVSDWQIEAFIERIRRELYSLNLVHGASSCSDRVTLSIGYANEGMGTGVQTYELMELADRALYQSKLKGRNAFTKQRNEVG